MPPAFNLSQDQTLQFNLCFWHFCLILSNRSLTQNTDRPVRFQTVLFFFFCEHLICKVLRSDLHQTAALPSSAHTYRLLIFKELHPACFASRCFRCTSLRFQQIVLFVSSRETRLCGSFRFPSTTLFILFSKQTFRLRTTRTIFYY